MVFRPLITSLRTAVSQLGPVNGFLYCLQQALERLSRGRCRFIRYYLVAQPIPEPFQPTCRPSARDTIRPVTPRDPMVAAFPRPGTVIQQRFANGNVCLCAVSKEEFAGFFWYARRHYDEDEVRCKFLLAAPETSVWDFDVHVEPEYRMGRTFVRLWDAANETLCREGIRWSFSRISAFNPQSLNSHGRMGIRRLHTLNFLCLGKAQVSFMTCRPFFHVSVSERDAPEIFLAPPKTP